MSYNLKDYWPEEREQLERGIFYYLNTTLGRYLWDICSLSAPLPDVSDVLSAITPNGIPLPDTSLLTELALAHALTGQEIPPQEQLDQEFAFLFGDIPSIDRKKSVPEQDKRQPQRRLHISHGDISAKVFADGLPRFPEHYLMGVYQSAQTPYEAKGPLRITEGFFDCFSLQTEDGTFRMKVNGEYLAEALVLASYNRTNPFTLPDDEELLEQIVTRYQADLQKLWSLLVRECRRVAPLRKTAVRLAKRIWDEQKLPPTSS